MRNARLPTLRGHFLMAALALVPLVLSTGPALAGSRQARERAARKACLAGDASQGVEILAELFVETKDSTYVYNQGRCFEQNRRYGDAAARFEEYLRLPDVQSSQEKTSVAQKHIADCEEKVAKERAASLPPTAPPPAFVPAPPPPSPSASPAVTVVDPPSPQPAAGERRWGLVTAGIVTGVVGVGGVVTGVVLNKKANSMVNEMETNLGAYSKSKTDEQKTYKTWAWVGYGVGAACAVAGGIMIALGASKSSGSSSSDLALMPALGPDHVGAILTGGFW
jgi:hypothetical protein